MPLRSSARVLRRLVLALLPLLGGCATLIGATRDGDVATLEKLLAAGADPNQATEAGTTPLFEAIEQGNLELVKLLVESGASVEKPSRCRGRMVTPLQKAAIHHDEPLIAYLLEKGADPTAQASGNNLLVHLVHLAEARRRVETSSVILGYLEKQIGHDHTVSFVDQRTENGWTALAAAAYRGDTSMVNHLLDVGASVTTTAKARNVDSDTEDEWPPLHFAWIRGHTEIVERLVAAGADPEAKSQNGRTASESKQALLARLAQEAEWRRQQQRDEEEQRARTYAAVMQGLQKGLDSNGSPGSYGSRGESKNPLDEDNGFQDRMKALYESEKKKNEEKARKAAEENAQRRREDTLLPPGARWASGPAGTDQLKPVAPAPASDASGPSSTQAESSRNEQRGERSESSQTPPRRSETPAPSSPPVPMPPAPPPAKKTARVLAVATVNEKLDNGCIRGALVSFNEREVSSSSAYSDFVREMKSEYPTGNNAPYESWSLVTEFVQQDETVVVVRFPKKEPGKKCTDTIVRFFVGNSYDDAWGRMQREANERRWQGVDRVAVWPRGVD